jgi:hypothetical protein
MNTTDNYLGETTSNFHIESKNKDIFNIIVTTSTRSKKNIPDILKFQIDIKKRQVIIDDKKIATYSALEKIHTEKSLKVRSKSRPKSHIDPIYETAVKLVHGTTKAINTTVTTSVGWIAWVIKKCLGIIYNELLDFGPLSLPIWGFILCLIPGMFPIIEIVSTNIFTWTLQSNRMGAETVQLITSQISKVFILVETLFGYKINFLPNYLHNFIVNSYTGLLDVTYILSPQRTNLLLTLLKLSNNNSETYILKDLINWFTNPVMYSSNNYMIQMVK